ncbi:MAG: cyclodeaminase/cyclohydrolase family protein [Oscillospiraceae bacterium]|nr:cyclodeaminase/cyclohydrolase family protein [Oscillospiraceae bacterium]
MTQKLSQLDCCTFTQQLASKAPVPGGGGAAALSAAAAASLCAMAGNLTVGKKKYAAVQAQLQQNIDRCEQLRVHFLALIDEDAQAFLPLQQAYSIPKDDPTRGEVMLKASIGAAQAPLEMLRSCNELSILVEEMAMLCSPLVVSDAGCAASLCAGAAEAAAMNVFINVSGLQGAAELENETAELLAGCKKRAAEVAAAVLRRVRKTEDK